VAEGARLESVYTGNRIVGSNPTPSARQPSGVVRSHSTIAHLDLISSCYLLLSVWTGLLACSTIVLSDVGRNVGIWRCD
jgi:hypothetical protein